MRPTAPPHDLDYAPLFGHRVVVTVTMVAESALPTIWLELRLVLDLGPSQRVHGRARSLHRLGLTFHTWRWFG